MNRNRFASGQKSGFVFPEIGQIWRRKDGQDAKMLLHTPYGQGFNCIFESGKGNVSFNNIDFLWDSFEYDCTATTDMVKRIEDDYDVFKNGPKETRQKNAQASMEARYVSPAIFVNERNERFVNIGGPVNRPSTDWR